MQKFKVLFSDGIEIEYEVENIRELINRITNFYKIESIIKIES